MAVDESGSGDLMHLVQGFGSLIPHGTAPEIQLHRLLLVEMTAFDGNRFDWLVGKGGVWLL